MHVKQKSFLLTGDQLLMYYGFSHRSVKWSKRVSFHLLDLSLVNSHIIFKAATGSKVTLLEFRTSVATSLLEGLERPCNCHAASAPELPLWLTERAFPESIPNKGRVDCKVCSDRGVGQHHQTGYTCRCKLCHTALCLYERYHSSNNHTIIFMCHHVQCTATLPLQVVRLMTTQLSMLTTLLTYVVEYSACMYTHSSHMQVSVRER